jgi:O-antigen ligase
MPAVPLTDQLGSFRNWLPGGALAFGTVTLLSFTDGGFFPNAWRAASTGLFCAAGLVLLLRGRVVLSRGQSLVAAAFATLVAWTALSALWSPDPDTSLLEPQRTLVYLALVLAAAAVAGSLLSGTLAAIGVVCAYALGQRLVEGPPDPPDLFEGTLLQEPLGYANGLGGLAAIGLAIAIAMLVFGAQLRLLHGLLACVFVVTLALTESRGGWLAAAIGTAIALVLGSGRLRLARSVAAATALLLVLALSLPAGSLADDLAERGGDRPWYWHVAWEEVAEAPVIGKGAGTFRLAWLEHQPIPVAVQDAHSLYLEVVAELGLVGLVLLGLALAPPVVAALRGVNAAAAGGYFAFLVHAGLEWDWELPAVTVAGLLCGAAVLACESASFGVESRLRSTTG